jgi:hypothetical protein
MKLNIGCGRNIMEGWVNIDVINLPGVNWVVNLDCKEGVKIPAKAEAVTEIMMSHVLEHIQYPLPLMQELWRAAAPDALCTIRCPYGTSDDADEDPTHIRRMFQGSFGYFSQPYFLKADYGYRGDWQPMKVELIPVARVAALPPNERWAKLNTERNVVAEMVATLKAIKPMRNPLRALQVWPTVTF